MEGDVAQPERPRVLPDRIEGGDGLLLREWAAEDADELGQAVTESTEHLRPWMAWIAQEPTPLELRRARIEEWRSDRARGGGAVFGIFQAGQIAGSCGLHPRIATDGLEIGYWVHPSFVRRGLGTRIARLLTDAALSQPGISHVEIHHDKANVASGGIPRKLGFRFLGEVRDEPKAPAELGVDWLWRMDKERWSSRGRGGAAQGWNQSLDAILVGGREKGLIVLVDYHPDWPGRFEAERQRIREALRDVAIRIEHIGSTAVPGLAAKPIVDVLVTVADPDDDDLLGSAMALKGYELRVREPGHRMFRTPARDVHVHIWRDSDPEVERHLQFRDQLRRSAEDRRSYEELKRELAKHEWTDMNDYADAKGPLIEVILERQ